MRRPYKAETKLKKELVDAMTEADVSYWQLAAVMGCHKQTVYNRMTMPSPEFAAQVMDAIAKIKASRDDV